MLLLTNDGAWADRVLHPRHGVEREYAIGLDRAARSRPGRRAARRDPARRGAWPRSSGLRPMTAIEVERLGGAARGRPPPDLVWYRATLTQGWKRQLRRMFGAVGAPVQRLVRVRIGPVRIDGLRSGAVRPLKAPEIRGLGAGGGRDRAQTPAEELTMGFLRRLDRPALNRRPTWCDPVRRRSGTHSGVHRCGRGRPAPARRAVRDRRRCRLSIPTEGEDRPRGVRPVEPVAALRRQRSRRLVARHRDALHEPPLDARAATSMRSRPTTSRRARSCRVRLMPDASMGGVGCAGQRRPPRSRRASWPCSSTTSPIRPRRCTRTTSRPGRSTRTRRSSRRSTTSTRNRHP